MINKIKTEAGKIYKEIVAIRRHLHKHPELSFHETATSAYIEKILKETGIPYHSGIAQHGIVAILEGKKKNKIGVKLKSVALRTDMDALPIQEENKVEYKSVNNGVMHACGHDVHTASLLGVVKILKKFEKEFSGIVYFIFQPAEERVPGGAKEMLESSCFKKCKPDVILAQHVESALESGEVGFKSGTYMASTDEIYITVKGKGGHAAMPHQNIDSILIASHIIVALQQIVSRFSNPAIPSVLSFGKIIGNGATNVIPDEVKIEGTFRTTNEIWREDAHLKMKMMARSIAEGMGGHCEFRILKGYPVLVNNPQVTEKAELLAYEYLGKTKVKTLDLKMTAEDFAYFAQKFPSSFYRLGIKNERRNITSAIHTSTFNVDESSLKTGMGLMAWLAYAFIKE